MSSEPENLGLFYRELYRSQFRADVVAGAARPLILPFDLLGPFIIPILYLCIPHTQRPWLYKMRFAVMALSIYTSFAMMRSASSANVAVAYGVGLMGSWGTIWGMKLLIWTRPQFDAARVQTRRRKPRGIVPNGNGTLSERRAKCEKMQEKTTAPDETVCEALDEYEYYWQPYPADGPFLTRLGWVVDLVSAFRGAGWNWSTAPFPRFQRPENPQSGEPVQLNSIPLATRSGYHRSPTYSAFIRDRLQQITWSYITLDFCSVLMVKDPYFVLGPGSPHPLPSFLAHHRRPILEMWRSALSFVGIYAAITFVFNVDQFLHCVLLRSLRGYFRPHLDLWQYPTVFGSFSDNILDRGLAGFWGGWWHQTFRGAFVAPSDWLARRGLLNPRSPAGAVIVSLIAFVLSGALHGSGGITSVPRGTVWWEPPLFFLFAWVGVVLQGAMLQTQLAKGVLPRLPRWLRRAANFAFVVLWMHLTRWAFIDDLSRAAIWLFEPVPVSPLRALGFGRPGDGWWRWDREMYPRWHVGSHWWEMGLAL